MNRAAALLTAGLVLLPAGGARAIVADLNTIREGDSIPAFKGRDIMGEEVDVGALLGKKILVLSFWSIYCKPCVEEISSLIRIQEEFGGEDLEVVGINADGELGPARIRAFMQRFEEFENKRINYRNIYDEHNRLSKLLGVGFLPTVLSVNLSGQVERMFTGYEEKSAQEIFEGMRALLPRGAEGIEGLVDRTRTFTAEAVVPLCGFYGADGWKRSFTGNNDLEQELAQAEEIARNKAAKAILKKALIELGVSLAHVPESEDCFRPYGVYLSHDPLDIQDSLTNFIRLLRIEQLVRVLESQGEFLGTEYRVSQTATVNLDDLRDALEDTGYRLDPVTVTFSVVNVKKLDQVKFERQLLRQSRFIGYANFPTYTVYATAEDFADEIKRMNFDRLRLFVEDVGEDEIELEVWR